MNNVIVMQILNGKQYLQHPSGNDLLHKQSLAFDLSLEMELKISILAVLLYNIGMVVFLDNLMQRDDIRMMQCFHECDLY